MNRFRTCYHTYYRPHKHHKLNNPASSTHHNFYKKTARIRKYRMKFGTAILFSSMATAIAMKTVELPSTLSSNSALGQKVLANARQLEANDAEVDYSWVTNYSIKFQGCHHVKQWNAEADEGADVRIATKRLIRFRLCPSSSCDSESSGGCSSGYGDYVVDMETYLMAYTENLEMVQEAQCEYLQENVCNCDNADDEESCMSSCYYNNGASYCIEEEADDAGGEPFQLADWVACAQADFGGRRRLDQGAEYFVGPYCSDEGSEVVLGLFTDDACSVFADDYGGRSTYKSMSGNSLPYSEESVLGLECISCLETQDANNDQNAAEASEMCQMMYSASGKCEENGFGDSNQAACNYMSGIKIMRSDGIIEAPAGSGSAAAFIGVFAAAFFITGGYAYYLKTKLDTINLS